MNIFKAYISGFKSTSRTWKMTISIYIIMLILGILVAIPFLGELKREAGNYISIQNLLSGHDHTVYKEFFNESKVYLMQFIKQGLWVGFLFFFLSIFFTGGILHIFSDKSYPYTIDRFFKGSVRFFFRFFKLSLYMLIPYVLFSAIISFVFYLGIGGSLLDGESEKSILITGLICISLWVVVMIYFLIIADYARFFIVKYDSSKVLRSLWESTRFVSRNIIFTYGLYLLLLVAPLGLIYIYTLLSSLIGVSSILTMIIMFLIQQLFICSRVFTRIWTFASQMDYYIYKSH